MTYFFINLSTMEDCNTESIAEKYKGDAEMVDILKRVERARKSHIKAKEQCEKEVKRKNAEVEYAKKHIKYFHQRLKNELTLLKKNIEEENQLYDKECEKRKLIEKKTADLDTGLMNDILIFT